MSRRRKPPLSPEDAALWARITRSVQPLPGRRPAAGRPRPDTSAGPTAHDRPPAQGKAAAGAGPRRSLPEKDGTATPPKAARAHAATPPKAAAGLHQHRHALQDGGTLDRRTRRRLIRGQIAIEARLDLHGFGVQEAHARLRAFITSARRQGLRTVLVITGKGGDSALARHTLHGYDYHHAPERRGRLRRLLPDWLSEPDLAEHVAGWQPAHPRHGGGGAFYIRLRRQSRS